MIDLSTEYLGLKLKSPMVVSSTPLSQSIAAMRRMEDCGASAVVLSSLFEEQLILESRALDNDLSRGTNSFAESLDYLPEFEDYRQGHETYVEHLRQAKAAVSIPVLASLNGATAGGWIRFAKEIEQAGADALELNTLFPGHRSADRQRRCRKGTGRTRSPGQGSRSRFPSPSNSPLLTTSVPNLAAQLDTVGADALVLFNRFYQPDFDIENLDVVPSLHFSTSEELLLRLHWVAILSAM